MSFSKGFPVGKNPYNEANTVPVGISLTMKPFYLMKPFYFENLPRECQMIELLFFLQENILNLLHIMK